MNRRNARCIVVAARSRPSMEVSISSRFFSQPPTGLYVTKAEESCPLACSMSGTNFQGDRGAKRLATNNERELVPYFIEDTVLSSRARCSSATPARAHVGS